MRAWPVRAMVFSVGLWAAAVGAQSAAAVDPPALEPGLWEITARAEFHHLPFVPKPRTMWVCWTDAALAAGLVPLDSLAGCIMRLKARLGENHWALDLRCDGLPPEAQVRGELQGQGRHMRAAAEVIQHPEQSGPARGHFTYHYQGLWHQSKCQDSPQG